MSSKSRAAFDENAKDLQRLLVVWGEFESLAQEVPQEGDEVEIPASRLVCLKSIIVLLVSYWEAYIEDICEEALVHIVNETENPDDLPKELKKAVVKHLESGSNDLAVWRLCGDQWRSVCLERLDDLTQKRNRNFNSPKSHLVNQYVFDAIGLKDVIKKWEVGDSGSSECIARLDGLLELRGAIAHRGRVDRDLTIQAVQSDVKFVKKLVSKTGGAINKYVRESTKIPLWEKHDEDQGKG